jgi:hypothetical protein
MPHFLFLFYTQKQRNTTQQQYTFLFFIYNNYNAIHFFIIFNIHTLAFEAKSTFYLILFGVRTIQVRFRSY